jgi:hypothetical protein
VAEGYALSPCSAGHPHYNGEVAEDGNLAAYLPAPTLPRGSEDWLSWALLLQIFREDQRGTPLSTIIEAKAPPIYLSDMSQCVKEFPFILHQT